MAEPHAPAPNPSGAAESIDQQPLRPVQPLRLARPPAGRRPPPRRRAAITPTAVAGPDELPVQGLDLRARPSRRGVDTVAWGRCPVRSPRGRSPVPCVPHERTGSLLLHHPDESPGSRWPAATGSRCRRRSGGSGGRTGLRPARAGPSTGSTGAKPLLQPSRQGYQSVAHRRHQEPKRARPSWVATV